MRRALAARLLRSAASPPWRACASTAGPSERVLRSLAPDAGGSGPVAELDLSGTAQQPHADLVCVNIMCEQVGGACICRLSRVLERPSLRDLRTLRLAGNGLTALPPSVWALRKLRVLDLRDNALEALPAEGLQQLQELRSLDTRGNPMHGGRGRGDATA